MTTNDPNQGYGQQQPYGQQEPNQGYGQQQPYGQQGYGAPEYNGQHDTTPPRNGLGTASLVLGILAVVLGVVLFILFVPGAIFGVIALILGIVARKRVKRGEATNGRAALAGIILGVIGILISAGLIIAAVAFVHSGTFQNLQDCAKSAGNDQAKLQQCNVEFSTSLGG